MAQLQRVGIIPCRMGSQRFPGKPLAQLLGVSMIEWVYRAVCKSALLEEVWVATESEEIKRVVSGFGATCIMTSESCATGTDRVRECLALNAIRVSRNATVVNVQGDEPLVFPTHIDAVVHSLESDSKAAMSTAVVEEDDIRLLGDPNVVKAVKNAQDSAMYFSRAPIPFGRDKSSRKPRSFLRHLGIYAFNASFLLDAYGQLPESRLERIECLEQLRIMEAGHTVKAVTVNGPAIHGVDTPEQLRSLEEFLLRNPQYRI